MESLLIKSVICKKYNIINLAGIDLSKKIMVELLVNKIKGRDKNEG
jgi:hypothetical protein